MGSESIAHEAVRARGTTVLIKTKQLVKNIETKQLYLIKFRLKPFFASKNPALFATSGL